MAWRSRATAWILGLALYIGAWAQPPDASFAGAIARAAFCQGRWRHGCRQYTMVVVWREVDGSVHAGWWHDPAVEARLESLPPDLSSQVRNGMDAGPRTRRCASLWAPMHETTSHVLFGLENRDAPMPADTAEYRAAMFDFLQADPSGRWAALPAALRAADIRTSRFLPGGALSNLLVLAGIGTLVAWFRSAGRMARITTLSELRRHRGQCVNCGYSRDGLGLSRCPECGQIGD